MPRPIKRQIGFTLIELLVVVAILALLMAIIMPALAKAKQKARNVLCSANLHQQSIALNAYAADFRRYPLGTVAYWWPFVLGRTDDPDPYTGKWYACAQGALIVGGYITDPLFFFCPAAPKVSVYYDGSNPVNFEYHWKRCYFPNDPKWQWGWGYGPGRFGPFISYSYWVGYKSGYGIYDLKLEKSVAKNTNSRGDTVITLDMMVTADPIGRGNYEGVEKYPIWSNHLNREGGELLGGNILFNAGNVTWRSLKPMLQNPDVYLKVRYTEPVITRGRRTGSNYWF